MENNKVADREPKYMVLNGAISRLQDVVDIAEALLRKITPTHPKEPEPDSQLVGNTVEELPVFQEVYDNAPHEINGQACRLEKIIAELREVLL
ncbi:hypothetical protein LCGC14_0813050 [marine sediment metagenome]|uniref:Uncharacterized protein n=1 Tax=marine sediment metagenome TaxID=412755 RepID=A0A0F9PL63_9ZZZZ